MAVAAYLLLCWLASGPRAEWPAWLIGWADLPFVMTWDKLPHEILWVLFFPLWFAMAMPLLQACGYGANKDKATIRSASLVNRPATNPVPRSAWIPPGVIWLIAVALVVAALNDESAKGDTTAWLAFGLLVTVVPMTTLFLGPWAVRMSLQEPEPLDPSGHPQLLDAYERLRRVKAWGFYGLTVAMLLLFCILLPLMAWHGAQGATIGIFGGVSGSLVGIGGATFGVMMSARRQAVRRLLEDLQQENGG